MNPQGGKSPFSSLNPKTDEAQVGFKPVHEQWRCLGCGKSGKLKSLQIVEISGIEKDITNES